MSFTGLGTVGLGACPSGTGPSAPPRIDPCPYNYNFGWLPIVGDLDLQIPLHKIVEDAVNASGPRVEQAAKYMAHQVLADIWPEVEERVNDTLMRNAPVWIETLVPRAVDAGLYSLSDEAATAKKYAIGGAVLMAAMIFGAAYWVKRGR